MLKSSIALICTHFHFSDKPLSGRQRVSVNIKKNAYISEMVNMYIMSQKLLLIVDDLSKVSYRLSFGTMIFDIIEV